MSDHSDEVDGVLLLDEIAATLKELDFRRDYENYLLGSTLGRFQEIGIPENMTHAVAEALNATGDVKAAVRADLGAMYVIPRREFI